MLPIACRGAQQAPAGLTGDVWQTAARPEHRKAVEGLLAWLPVLVDVRQIMSTFKTRPDTYF